MNAWFDLSYLLMGSAVLLLIWAALHDFAARTVPNALPVAILAAGFCVRWIDHTMLLGLTIAFGGFVLLFGLWRLGWIGGGDVKLWSAAITLVPPQWQTEFSCVTRILLAGGFLALLYLSLRLVVPCPHASRTGSLLARVVRVEAWRISRKAPLPYAIAIAGGTIVSLMPFSLSAPR